MVAYLFYWFSILVNIAWVILSVGFSIYYLAKKEDGNLWFFGLFNVLAIIYLAVVFWIYHTWDFGVTLATSLLVGVIIANAVLTILQAILGRAPKPTATTK